MSNSSDRVYLSMEDAVRQRINDFLKIHHSNETAIANGNSALQRMLNRQLAHNATLTIKAIEAVYFAFPNINLEWLMTGLGSMIKIPQSSMSVSERGFMNNGNQNLNVNIHNPDDKAIIESLMKDNENLCKLLEEKEKTNRSLERTINILTRDKQ